MLRTRPTVHEDLARLVEWETDPDTSVWLGETGRDWHERALADPNQDHILAERDGALSGFAVLAGIRRTDRVLELRRMVVSPAQRGAGRGRALLRAALACAYEHHGAGRVWLDVKAHNRRARALYESEGFAVTDVLAGAVGEPDGTATDLVIMVHRPR
ncbi:GNAT family N-acetyltransferase [Microbispora sp. NEAU-D428]|uniref:GNAT family N-acetyltransferase n=1 Tax=Microbispora sitophila TaxID=2771537 RepID=UPI0018683551|nr:GNAT family N-acetyltransferase [Microbispora sitophila]MBE3007887.1 GNAT family N-acetyltransferase [Microbispora sitophila]